MNNAIVLDIETLPAPAEVLAKLTLVFEPPSNYKDPAKIAEALKAKAEAWQADSALHAERGQVAIVGWMHGNRIDQLSLIQSSDLQLMEGAWTVLQGATIIGFNILRFDLPFMIRRSMILGVTVPPEFLDLRRAERDGLVIDLMVRWQCGDNQERVSLDTLAKAFGLEGKSGSGADFPALWASDREAALKYNRHDLELTQQLAKKMGVM